MKHADPHRPTYHFLPPANWMNDPNGFIHWQGQYHLFYQHNPYSPQHHHIHWGHAVSRDLVHWQHLPIALKPTPDGPDADGCWSGSAVVDGGVPTLIYSGVFPQVVCIATSDEKMIHWQKYEHNPVIARVPDSIDAGNPWEFRDPFVWQEDGNWYMLMGTRIVDKGGAILLYRSQDLRQWEFMHTLMQGDRNQLDPFWTGTVWECPNLFKLGNRHVLIVSFQHHESGQLLYTGYFNGRYEDHHFTPESQYIVDYGAHFYAPQVIQDEQGRHIMLGWLWEGRSDEAQRQAGWAGVMSLPRLLTLRPEGKLGMQPVPELQTLRRRHWRKEAHQQDEVTAVRGNTLELRVRLAPNLGRVGVRVLCSDDEHTTIYYDRPRALLGIDRLHASCEKREEYDLTTLEGHFTLPADELLELHIFIDKSVIEVFANGEVTLTGRVYPSREDSLGVEILADAGEFLLLEAWQLGTIW